MCNAILITTIEKNERSIWKEDVKNLTKWSTTKKTERKKLQILWTIELEHASQVPDNRNNKSSL